MSCLFYYKFVFFNHNSMKKTSFKRFCFCSNIFSSDKHWVFLLLICSNLVLLSLIFVLLNQNQTTTPNQAPSSVSTTSVSTTSASTNIPTIASTFPEIKRLLLLVLAGQQPLTVDAQKISSFSPQILQFYDNSETKSVFYTFRLKTYQYTPGAQLVSTISGKKYTADLDKWVKWLSNLNNGQETQVYSDQGLASKTTTIISKKIGSNVYFINDYKQNSGWTREYVTYDTNQKEIIKIIIETSEPNEFFPATLNLFSQIESALAVK